jgi:hypothetical protein
MQDTRHRVVPNNAWPIIVIALFGLLHLLTGYNAGEKFRNPVGTWFKLYTNETTPILPKTKAVKQSHPENCNGTISIIHDLVDIRPDAAIDLVQKYASQYTFKEGRDLYAQMPKDLPEEVAIIGHEIAMREGRPWSDIDWHSGFASGTCGGAKCFYRSLSNSSTGYMLTRQIEKGDSSRYTKYYNREQKLVREYGIPQLSLGPFREMTNVSESMKGFLEAFGHTKRQSTIFWAQHVVTIPEPNLIVRSAHKQIPVLKRHIPSFARTIRELNMVEKFRENFQKDAKKFQHLMADPENRFLLHDFQFVLGHDGTWYHMDLDRDWSRFKPDKYGTVEEMINNVQTYADKLLYWFVDANGNFTGLEQDIFCVKKRSCEDAAAALNDP